jgi:DNA-binding response OmpR family regulator
MDVRVPELDGIEATRGIADTLEATRVLVLTTFDNDEIVVGALRAGASGFLLEDAPGSQLVSAIRVIAGDSSMFAPHVTRRLIEEFVGRRPTAAPGLTDLSPRAGGAATRRARTRQRRHRRSTRAQRAHRQDPRREHPLEARPARPHAGCRVRIRGGRRARDP